MTHQLIDRGKIYLYFSLLLVLLSIHNINSTNLINNFFKIKKITLDSNIDESINEEIFTSLKRFYNLNIFSENLKEIENILDKFNIINEYKIKKEYPSNIKIELIKTNILAYYYDNNEKTYLGENGKKIKDINSLKTDLPLIIGKVDINNFLSLNNKLMDNGFELNDFVKFYAFKSNRWDLLYRNKILIKLPIDEVDFSLNLLKRMLKNSNLENVNIIDLRIKNRIILT